jgi:hypothetical protein
VVPAPSQNSVIQIDRLGGTVLAPWGAMISYEVHPQQYDFQPNHTYLVKLGYHTKGDFYTAGIFKTFELWDLTDGTVKPCSHLQAARSTRGQSEISGISADSAIRILDNKFEEHYKNGRQN